MSRYGRRHRHTRKMWQRRLTDAWGLGQTGITCWRCKKPICRDQPWDLGHYDNSDVLAGPEHRVCNRATAGRRTS